MKNQPCSCNCGAETDKARPALLYPCSGAADVGEIADRAARRLDAADRAWMSCLAGIGARASGLMASAGAAPTLIAIDGCPQDCATKVLRLAGFEHVRSVRVTDLGFKKGQAPVTDAAVQSVATAIGKFLPPASTA